MDLFNINDPNEIGKILTKVKKGIGVYYRVSGGSQSLKLQKDAIRNWVLEKGISWDDEIEVFNENVLSANQVVMENRPELMRLLKAIESGQIKVVIVYARDRLARNFYEYMEIVQIFLRYKVKVVFVGGTAPFSYNYLTEGIYGIQIQQDGTNIASRIQAVQNLYPYQKFGYINDKENKEYKINEKYHYNISTFFEDVSNVSSFTHLCELLKGFKKENKRNSIEDCWKLLRTSFYAGHNFKNGTYYQLKYVEPIISLELYNRVQKIMEHYEIDFIKALRVCEKEAIFAPNCGLCSEKMTHKEGKIGESSYYYCKNHRKNNITVQELDTEIMAFMSKLLKKLSSRKLNRLGIYSINNVLRKLSDKREQINTIMETNRKNYFLLNSKSIEEFISRKKELQIEEEYIGEQINDLVQTKAVFTDIDTIIKQRLFFRMETEEVYVFLSLFLESIQISNESIDFRVYFTEFMEEEIYEQ